MAAMRIKEKLFSMEHRSKLRRLAPLGITGHQPAVAALCKTSEAEQQSIAEAILKQKVGANATTAKHFKAFQAERNQLPEGERAAKKILVKIARVANGAVVRWQRAINESSHRQQLSPETEQQAPVPLYQSRMIACTRCNQPQETCWMQLRTVLGFRAVHCRNCGKQERTARNKCQCGCIWHQCLIHKVDPLEHQSRKAANFTSEQKQERNVKRKTNEKKGDRAAKRKAPEVQEANLDKGSKQARKARLENEYFRKQGFEDKKLSPMLKELQQRIKLKEKSETATLGQEGSSQKVRPADEHEEQAKPKTRKLCEEKAEATSIRGGSNNTRRSLTEAMREAVSNQQIKKRRSNKADDEAEAVFEDKPKLPGEQGETHAILERLWSRRSDYGPQAVYEDAPQLPGKRGQTKAILRRLKSEAQGPSSVCSEKRAKQKRANESSSIGDERGIKRKANDERAQASTTRGDFINELRRKIEQDRSRPNVQNVSRPNEPDEAKTNSIDRNIAKVAGGEVPGQSERAYRREGAMNLPMKDSKREF